MRPDLDWQALGFLPPILCVAVGSTCIEHLELQLCCRTLRPANSARGWRVSGHLHMSPGVLASMWKEEETRVKDLEQKMKALLKEKQVAAMLAADFL